MLDSRKTKPNCSQIEEIVSYVYDELQSAEKLEFEKHLSNCSICENELEAFGSVVSSVKEWRNMEFSGLKTPEIEIPYETSSKPALVASSVEESESWMENLRGFFAGFGMKTVAGFASLVVVLGLGWFLVSSLTGEDRIAETPKDEAAKPITDKENLTPVAPDSVEIAEDSEAETKSPSELPEVTPELAGDNSTDIGAKRNTPTQIGYKQTAVKNRKLKRRNVKKKRNPSKRVKTPKKEKEAPVIQAPIDRLTEEFAIDEKKDDELRLTDLFDEAGSDK